MSRAHAACVCMPRAAGPPCSQGGFCSPAMMDGRIGPFRPAMLQQRYLHNTGLPPVTSDTAQPGLGPPPTPASPGLSDTSQTQPMGSPTLGLGGPHSCRDALSADAPQRALPAPRGDVPRGRALPTLPTATASPALAQSQTRLGPGEGEEQQERLSSLALQRVQCRDAGQRVGTLGVTQQGASWSPGAMRKRQGQWELPWCGRDFSVTVT